MNTDNRLLAEYAHHGSEGAFRELVERHINLVHAAALRESRGDDSLAEDITQAVFAELARLAARLLSHPAIAGWLYTCVRRMAANALRADQRRKDREQKAFTMNEALITASPDPLWEQVRPVLDDVMHELNDEDRAAVLLRFFEERSLKEVGTALGLTENAARMRVERSLEKLHRLLARRGVHSSASTLSAVLVAGAALKAPSTLASSVATAAMAKAATVDASILTSARLLAFLRTKTGVAAALATITAAVLIFHHLRPNPAETITQPESNMRVAVANASGPATPEGSPATQNQPAADLVSELMAFQLLETDTSDPLPGAKLYLFYMFDDGRGKVVKAVTDTNGRVGVEKPRAPYRGLNFFVAADGHVPKVISWGFKKQMPSQYTMKLERGVTIGGIVIDPAGQPISGAKIQFDGEGNNMSLEENISSLVPIPS
jgi:RNA polymerase sigma factor (sigma-70 family)